MRSQPSSLAKVGLKWGKWFRLQRENLMLLTAEQLDNFEQHGYVVARGLLDPESDLQPVIDEYADLLDQLISEWQLKGYLQHGFERLPFGQRLISAVTEAEQRYDDVFDISLPQVGVDHNTPIHVGAAVFNLIRTPALLDTVEQLIGPEIYSNPVQHTRVKLPELTMPDPVRTAHTAQVEWHQDLGVITDDADESNILTVWFPITDSQLDNGCMAVAPGSHKKGLVTHCKSKEPLTLGQTAIPKILQEEKSITLPMLPGDVLFMHKCTHHAGLPNQSDRIRWSFDLRYQPIGEPSGRAHFPGFIARSKFAPDTVLNDVSKWAQLWYTARDHLADQGDLRFNRWDWESIYCA